MEHLSYFRNFVIIPLLNQYGKLKKYFAMFFLRVTSPIRYISMHITNLKQNVNIPSRDCSRLIQHSLFLCYQSYQHCLYCCIGVQWKVVILNIINFACITCFYLSCRWGQTEMFQHFEHCRSILLEMDTYFTYYMTHLLMQEVNHTKLPRVTDVWTF